MRFNEIFKEATNHEPYPYQARLAHDAPSVLDVPTGLGKTEATVLGWLYRRTNDPDGTPRRLIYCLPMRSLVEQTRDRIDACFARLAKVGVDVPKVEVVMGGDVGEEWFRFPEWPYVAIGTQDMLLSRALNRGYGMSRFQWSMTFGAANDDVYWVVDEVQLQGIGAVTAAQLQAFRENCGTFHGSQLTLTSATIEEEWFETADFSLQDRTTVSLTQDDEEDETVQRVLHARKHIERVLATSEKEIATIARERHRAGTRTLLVANRVARAQEIYEHLKRGTDDVELVLLHSRFRRGDRERHARELLADVDPSGPGRIVIATQVVEAGIDVSAATLISDIAPWSSLVQRFGRCNRRGNDADAVCVWIDSGELKRSDVSPYVLPDLVEARELLIDLEGASAAPSDLPRRSIPLRGGLVIRKPEFLDLFDTSPDLSGHDVDVSPYIREADEMTATLFWRDAPPRGKEDSPQGDELCAAAVSRVRELVKGLRSSGRGADARIGNQFASGTGEVWTELHQEEIRPGITIWLRGEVGWYDPELGFRKNAQRVQPVPVNLVRDFSESCAATESDALSEGMPRPVSLSQHAQDTLRHARALAEAVRLPEVAANVVKAAALWHDVGKAHEVFQDTMRRANGGTEPDGVFWAKGVRRVHHRRRGFRHELPGALAYLEAYGSDPRANAIAFLIAAHHGKLRFAAHQLPYEAELEPFQLMGSIQGETLPAADLGGGIRSVATTISLEPFKIGSIDGKPSWVERTTELRDDASYGPFRLAYMELLVRLADWRASEEEAQ